MKVLPDPDNTEAAKRRRPDVNGDVTTADGSSF